jgi:two-component system chemotaxis sensor kinase CheA
MDDSLKEIIEIFFVEAKQNIDDLEALILEQAESCDPSQFKVMFRLAHNLKGSSKSVGFSQIGRVTHEFETILLKLGDGVLELNSELLKIFLKNIDTLKSLLNHAISNGNDNQDVGETLTSLSLYSPKSPAPIAPHSNPTTPEPCIPDPTPPSDSSSDIIFLTATEDVKEPKMEAVKPSHSSNLKAEDTIRVGVTRVDRLQNHVGELLVLESVLTEQLRGVASPLLRSTLRLLSKATKEIQDDVMGLRLVSLKSLASKLKRSVQDAALELGKEVDFVVEGEAIEVDKMISEGLADPLNHMVRNAVDHGLEPNQNREALGKARKGKICLKARIEGGGLEISLSDDGKGLNPKLILEKALQKKLIRPDTKLTDTQVFELIFKAGFSTKEHVTEISGRGVGMDVVKTNLEAMRGTIKMSSQLGQGTQFTIQIPLSLSIVEGMIVLIGEEKWIIPLYLVSETIRIEQASTHHVPGLGRIITLRNKQISLVDLREFIGLKKTAKTPQSVILVCQSKEETTALEVDQVIGIQTIVTKPLGPEAHVRDWVSGCAILGDGKTSLIFDLAHIQKSIKKQERLAS